MNKPKEILELEKIYGIELTYSENSAERNTYHTDKENNVIALNLANNEINEIKGLEYLFHLTKLNISNNSITEIKGLENLQQLTHLNLSYNKIN